jgi:hypothetical protein
MKVNRHHYSRDLKNAAEEFLIGQFQGPTQFVDAPHLPDLIEAAMHIVTGAAWVQPGTTRDAAIDVPLYERGGEDDEDEDEE